MHALIAKFNTTGNVADAPRSGHPKTVLNDYNRDAVVTAFTASPHKSTRRASCELQISATSIRRILHDIGMKPYRPRILHALNEDDPDRRAQFCQTFLQFYNDSPEIVDHILWSDEATFKTNGHVNRHNCVYWSEENPHEIIEKELNVPGITVWGGITSAGLVGPFFFESTVTGALYLKMLQEKVWSVISQREHIGELYFQQDGAPPHYATIVRNWLDDNFPNRWIGCRGPVEWPPRWPDLSPPDFFLWGVLKNAVYAHKPRTVGQLKEFIQLEWKKISPDTCTKVCHSVVRRFSDCSAAAGRYFEHLYDE